MLKLNTIINYSYDRWPYVHDTMISGKNNFYGPDSDKLYQRNLKNLDSSWIYHNKNVEYNFNSLGLRMDKEISEVDRNYIYFSGTSFSMGIGICSKDRFSELLSKDLSLDFINYSGPTYTIKLQVLSFFNFLKTNQKPKILVIEYPPSYAYTFFKNNKAIMYYSKHIPDTEYNIVYEEMLKTDFFEHESEIYRSMLTTLCKESNIQLVELSFHPNDVFSSHEGIIVVDPDSIDVNDINQRYARDVMIQNNTVSAHPGIGVHEIAYEKIKEVIV